MDWIATIINGLLLGGLYGLFGLGLAFAFGIMRIVNVAHGEFIVLAAYIGLFVGEVLPINPFVLVLIIAVLSFGFGYLLQTGLLNRVMDKDPLPPLLVTFGLSIVLRNLMVELFGADLRTINPGPVRLASFEVFGLTIGVLPVIILAVAVALFTILHFTLMRSPFGRIVRATADDAGVVELYGVNYRHVFGLAMGIAVSVSSIAGMLLAMRTAFTPFSGVDRLLISFEVVIIGGLGSIWGTLIGGLILGVAHLVGSKFDPGAGLLYAHLVFFLILIFLPQGLSQWRR